MQAPRYAAFVTIPTAQVNINSFLDIICYLNCLRCLVLCCHSKML